MFPGSGRLVAPFFGDALIDVWGVKVRRKVVLFCEEEVPAAFEAVDLDLSAWDAAACSFLAKLFKALNRSCCGVEPG